jgi:hypothetical protein
VAIVERRAGRFHLDQHRQLVAELDGEVAVVPRMACSLVTSAYLS